jgi:hypothetical protein
MPVKYDQIPFLDHVLQQPSYKYNADVLAGGLPGALHRVIVWQLK